MFGVDAPGPTLGMAYGRDGCVPHPPLRAMRQHDFSFSCNHL